MRYKISAATKISYMADRLTYKQRNTEPHFPIHLCTVSLTADTYTAFTPVKVKSTLSQWHTVRTSTASSAWTIPEWKRYLSLYLRTAFYPIKDLILPVWIHLVIYCLLTWLPAVGFIISVIFVGVTMSPWQRLGFIKQSGDQHFLVICASWKILGSLMGN